MSIDYILGPREPNGTYDREAILNWFRGRSGYESPNSRQAVRDRGDNYVLFDLAEEPVLDPELDEERPIFIEAHTGVGGGEKAFMENVAEIRELCQAFDLLVCDPQGERFAFLEPAEVLG
ncbi:hypothetical protein AB6B38_11445 [Glycocaulis abyssi]|uniref:Uncharacterized protein n=1 Tax=Glycocaulis abyssi TaxID=1433403 RepID=A0ABV9NFE4_9PROT